MAIFRYEVVDAGGKVLRGAMDAPSMQDVAQRLSGQGYKLLQLHDGNGADVTAVMPHPPGAAVVSRPPLTPSSSGIGTGRGFAPPLSQSRVSGSEAFGQTGSLGPGAEQDAPLFGPTAKPEQLGLFFRQMASLIHSGFTVGSALQDLGMRTSNSALAEAVRSMASATANGASLSVEMARYPTLFPPNVTGLVAAGETGGFLEFSFEEAALNQEQDAYLGQGLWLTRVLIWQAVWSVLILLPLFPCIDPNNIPGSIAHYSRVMTFVIIPLGILMHLASHFGGQLWRRPAARRLHDSLSLRIPVMARLANMRALAAFTRVLRRLLASGISPEPAFAAASRSVPNVLLAELFLEKGMPIVRAHEGIDAAVAATGLMGNDPLQLLVTGQKTGQWMEMLDRVTVFYQDEAARATEGARAFQKRAGVIITLVSIGYVSIVGTAGLYQVMWKFLGTFE